MKGRENMQMRLLAVFMLVGVFTVLGAVAGDARAATLSSAFTNNAVSSTNITTITDVIYSNCVIRRVDPDGITVVYAKGVAKILFTELPEEWRAKYNYDPEKADQFAQEKVKLQQAQTPRNPQQGSSVAGDAKTSSSLYADATSRVNSAIRRDRSALNQEIEKEETALRKQVAKLRKSTKILQRAPQHFPTATDYRMDEMRRELRARAGKSVGGSFSEDAGNDLSAAEASLKALPNTQKRRRTQFKVDAKARQKRVQDIFADQSRRLQNGESISRVDMEKAFAAAM
jgi:hypothetical protein